MSAMPRCLALVILTGTLLGLSATPSQAVDQICVHVTVWASDVGPIAIGPCVVVPIPTQCDAQGAEQPPVGIDTRICY